jgi:hypothetical protein
MKLLRLIALAVAVVLVLLVGAGVALFQPSVQTRLARSFLRRPGAVTGQVESLHAGWKTTEWTNLQLHGNGWSLTMPSARAEVPLMGAVQRDVHVHSFTAHGWVLDFSTAGSAPAQISMNTVPALRWHRLPLATVGFAQISPTVVPSATPSIATAFRGVFPLLDLPFDFAVDEVDLEGEVVFRSQTGGPVERIHVTVTGGGLAAGPTAKFVVTGDSAVNLPAMPLSSVRAQVNVQARLATPRRFDLLQLDGHLSAENSKAAGPRLFLTASINREGDHEAYVFSVRAGDAVNAPELVQAQASFPDAQGRVSGNWQADTNDTQFTPFLLGAELPSFSVKGSGKFDADSAFQEVHAAGNFTGQMARWRMIAPSLANFGPLQFQGNFDVLQNGKTLRIEQLAVQVADSNPIVSLAALQGIEFDAETAEVRVADPRKDLVKVTLAAVPIAWIQPYLPNVKLSGGPLRGELIARARESGLQVRSTAPLVCADLSLRAPDRTWIEHVDAVLSLSGSYSSEGWQADVSNVELHTDGRVWLTADAKIGQSSEPSSKLKSTGHYKLDLIGASHQPAFAQLNIFQGGAAEGDFSAILGAIHQFAANVELKSLAIAGIAAPLPSASLLVRADVQANGNVKLQVPFQVQHGTQHSDGQLSADVHPEGKDYIFDAQFTSDLVSIDDLLGIASAFNTAAIANAKPAAPVIASDSTQSAPASSRAQASAVTATPAAPRTQSTSSRLNAPIAYSHGPSATASAATANSPTALPVWAGYRGKLLLGLKRVTDLSAGFEANDVAGRIQIEPTGITFDHLTATLGNNGTALLAADLTFDPKDTGSYNLSGELDLNHVNPGPYLKAVSDGQKPTVEGIFDLAMKFNGEAATLDQLSDQLSEDVRLTSRSGKFRGFAPSSKSVDIDKLQRTASTVGAILSAAAGMVGYGEGVSYSDKLRAAADVLRGFSEISYDQLNVELTHPAGQDTKIADISLISPEIRFVGNGTVDTTSTADWFARPVHLQVAVAVRGQQAEDMKKIGLVGADKDTLGYVPLLDKFPVEGSASSLATEALGKLLNRALVK